MSDNLFQQLLEEYNDIPKYKEGDILSGIIVNITDRYVVLDFGYKSEGYMMLKEISTNGQSIDLKIGDEIKTYLELLDNGYGQMVLSYEKAQQQINEDLINKSLKSDDSFILVKGKRLTEKGIVVDFNNTECFMPFSLADTSRKEDYSFLIKDNFKVKVVKYQPEKNNILVSRKVVLEKEGGLNIKEKLNSLNMGDTLEGVVKNFVKYGAFVDLGFIDSLVHINELSWKKVNNVCDHIEKGKKYNFVVKGIDTEKNRLTLSFRENDLEPWLNIVNNFNVDDIIECQISDIDENGVLVRYSDSIDFYVHRSELCWQRFMGDINNIFSIGDSVKCKIKDFKNDKKSLLLSIKDASENPLPKFVSEHSVGDEVNCEIENIGKFELFVNIDGNVPAVITQNEVSWEQDKVILNEKFKVGEKISAQIKLLNNDKIILSIKELHQDPMQAYRTMKKGTEFKGKIEQVKKNRLTIKTSENLDVLLKIDSEFSVDYQDIFSEGDILDLLLEKVKDRKILASLKDDFLNQDNQSPTIGDNFN